MGVESVSFMNGRRVVVVAIGSRGDVVPMVNLARRIASTGTETEIIGLSDYSFLAVGNGIQFRSIGRSMENDARCSNWRTRTCSVERPCAPVETT